MQAKVKIEFAGLVLAIVSSDKKQVSMTLLDSTSVGGPKHSPVLLIKDHEGLRGAPDFTVTMASDGVKPGDEFAGWILSGEVQVSGTDAAPLTLNLGKTGDLKKVAGATVLAPSNERPISAMVTLTSGDVTSSGVEGKFDFEFVDAAGAKQRVYGSAQALTDRVTCDLTASKPFRIRFDSPSGRRVVTVAQDVGSPIIISNLVAGSGKATPHFDVYFEVPGDGTRQPTIKRVLASGALPQTDPPDNPDECRLMMFEQ